MGISMFQNWNLSFLCTELGWDFYIQFSFYTAAKGDEGIESEVDVLIFNQSSCYDPRYTTVFLNAYVLQLKTVQRQTT